MGIPPTPENQALVDLLKPVPRNKKLNANSRRKQNHPQPTQAGSTGFNERHQNGKRRYRLWNCEGVPTFNALPDQQGRLPAARPSPPSQQQPDKRQAHQHPRRGFRRPRNLNRVRERSR